MKLLTLFGISMLLAMIILTFHTNWGTEGGTGILQNYRPRNPNYQARQKGRTVSPATKKQEIMPTISTETVNLELLNCTKNSLKDIGKFGKKTLFLHPKNSENYLLDYNSTEIKNFVTFLKNPDNPTNKRLIIRDIQNINQNSNSSSLINYLVDIYDKLTKEVLELAKADNDNNSFSYIKPHFYQPLGFQNHEKMNSAYPIDNWNTTMNYNGDLNFLNEKFDLLKNEKLYDINSKKIVEIPRFLISKAKSSLSYNTLIEKLASQVNTKYKGYSGVYTNLSWLLSFYEPVLYGYIIVSENGVNIRFQKGIKMEYKGKCQNEGNQEIEFLVCWGVKQK